MRASRLLTLLLCVSIIFSTGCTAFSADTRPEVTEFAEVVVIDTPAAAAESIYPSKIPTEKPTELPANSVTAEPTSEPDPAPTDTPEPTNAPEPTATAKPTAAPEPMHTPLSNAEKSMLINFEHRLPDGYVPHDLVNAKELMGSSAKVKSDSILIQYEVGVQLKTMFETAYSEGISCKYRINSAYRTMEKQWQLWNNKVAADPHYGEDPYAHPVGVMPGNASEHVAGLAVDLGSTDHPDEGASFGNTPEGIWLKNNAHRFGFILRYPADKTHVTGVKNEPWHLRYVGVELAQVIYESGLCLEEYFGELPNSLVAEKDR